MGLVAKDYLVSVFHLIGATGDRAMTFSSVASIRVGEAVGGVAYADALLPVPADPGRKTALQLAEAHLLMYLALPSLNATVRPTGAVDTEKIEGGAILTYKDTNELFGIRASYLRLAADLIGEYALSPAGLMSVLAPGRRIGGSTGSVTSRVDILWR